MHKLRNTMWHVTHDVRDARSSVTSEFKETMRRVTHKIRDHK